MLLWSPDEDWTSFACQTAEFLHLYVKVFGKWVYVMGAGDPLAYHKALEATKSSWVELSPTSDVNTVTLRFGDYML